MSLNHIMWAAVVRAVHLCVVGYVVLTPCVANSTASLAAWLVTVLCLLVHWAAASDACILTVLEAKLTGNPVRHGFIYSIVGPLFNLHIDHAGLVSRTTWIVTLGLGALGVVKLWRHWRRQHLPVERRE